MRPCRRVRIDADMASSKSIIRWAMLCPSSDVPNENEISDARGIEIFAKRNIPQPSVP